MFKYPRTRHIRGSRFQNGDHDLEAVPLEELAGRNLVVEEKIDGANAGVSFSEAGELLLQSRGHYLTGGPRERHFNMLKQWAATHQDALYYVLGSRYVMYGEWMFAKHTFFYDALPHYFFEFDVLDTETGKFLDTPSRKSLLHGGDVKLPIEQVLVLKTGEFGHLDELRALIGRSHFITDRRMENLRLAAEAARVPYESAVAHTDPSTDMEGLYIKWEEDGEVKGRYKFVRESFTNSILDQDEHWLARPIIQNRLNDGSLEGMFQQ